MWRDVVKTPVVSTGAAAIFTTLSQHLSTKQSELCSEICCWLILPGIIRAGNTLECGSTARMDKVPSLPWASQKPASVSLWVVAVSLAAICWYKAEIGTIELFVSIPLIEPWTQTDYPQPVLTPIVLIFERKLRSGLETSETADNWLFSFLCNKIWGSTLVSVLLIFFLSPWSLLGSVLSLLPVACLVLIYIALVPRRAQDAIWVPRINIEKDIVSLSYRTTLLLCLLLGAQAARFGLTRGIIFASLLSGLFRALSWYCVIQAVREIFLYSCDPIELTSSRHGTLHGRLRRESQSSGSWLPVTHLWNLRICNVFSTLEHLYWL